MSALLAIAFAMLVMYALGWNAGLKAARAELVRMAAEHAAEVEARKRGE